MKLAANSFALLGLVFATSALTASAYADCVDLTGTFLVTDTETSVAQRMAISQVGCTQLTTVTEIHNPDGTVANVTNKYDTDGQCRAIADGVPVEEVCATYKFEEKALVVEIFVHVSPETNEKVKTLRGSLSLDGARNLVSEQINYDTAGNEAGRATSVSPRIQ